MAFTAIDHLLACMHVIDRDQGDVQIVGQWMGEAGFTEPEIAEAWVKAKRFGYTRTTGLGADELTPSGVARGIEVARLLGI